MSVNNSEIMILQILKNIQEYHWNSAIWIIK